MACFMQSVPGALIEDPQTVAMAYIYVWNVKRSALRSIPLYIASMLPQI